MGLRYSIAILFVMVQWFSTPCAQECNDLAQMSTCDECFKCGGLWCNDPNEYTRCVPLTGGGDEWCPENMEPAPYVEPDSRDGQVFRPQFENVLAEINSGKVTTLHITGYSATKSGSKTVYHKVLNTTSDQSKVRVETHKHQSTIQVTTTIRAGFCSPSSQKFENVFVEVGMAGVGEKAVLKYVVPCSCGCSEEVVTADQEYCHGHGDLVCGTCRCHKGWHGKFCECGPASSSCADSSNTRTTLKCSGNGQCDKCSQCQCFTDKEGSQYFDQQDNCKDLSATVNDFLDCQKTQQSCGKCDRDVFFHKWDGSLLNQLYDASRKLWVNLGSTLPGFWGCVQNSTIHIMRKPLC